ncbi:uncharacterized protein LOC115660270 [Gopherus evgoodei]|uniref:uncharacterized protein LOC115660270 n=1 Tax=Gopherus evgoodei TaxID=1825980 RepID=UPI0011CFA1A9|nr:uncharacterized protein LOC115660270 [Gopherus evgoodei]
MFLVQIQRCIYLLERTEHREAVPTGHSTEESKEKNIHVIQSVQLDCQDRSDFVCMKCKLVYILEEKVRGLENQGSTLGCFRENEDFLDKSVSVLEAKCAEESETAEQSREEYWQHVTSRGRKRRTYVPLMQIEVHNHFQALCTRITVEKDLEEPCEGRSKEETPSAGRHGMNRPRDGGSTITTPKRRRQVGVVRDSPLRGIESSIYQPDWETQEVCCFPGARIQDVTECLLRLIKISDHYPFLLLHVGTNDTSKNDL